jgi:hypothetical protein
MRVVETIPKALEPLDATGNHPKGFEGGSTTSNGQKNGWSKSSLKPQLGVARGHENGFGYPQIVGQATPRGIGVVLVTPNSQKGSGLATPFWPNGVARPPQNFIIFFKTSDIVMWQHVAICYFGLMKYDIGTKLIFSHKSGTIYDTI